MLCSDLIAIFGPTGVGKTAVAVALAAGLRAHGQDPVAVSADALQIYAGLEILSAAPGPAERAELEHRLTGFVPVSEAFSVGAYARLAHAEIDGLIAAGRRPIIVGGTGLYLRAAIGQLDLKPPVDPAVRAALAERLTRDGAAALHAELVRRAPARAARIAPTDPQRITRALELLESGEDPHPGADQLWTAQTRIPTRLFGLSMDRDALYARIDRRVETMIAAGAAEEARRAEAAGAGPSARKALGFRELLDGDPEAMAHHTRRYARRQLTWMAKLPDVTRIDLTGITAEQAAAQILEHLMI